MPACFIGVDVGLTTAKAAAFDEQGRELKTFRALNPRVALTPERQEIDMLALATVVTDVLVHLTGWLASEGWVPAAIGVTGHGNGLYLVDADGRPVRPAIASTDTRAAGIAAGVDPDSVLRVSRATGSLPWAGQPAVLLRWLKDHEPDALERTRWALTSKDWITSRLTGRVSADYSDGSGSGLINLRERVYEADAFAAVGLDPDVRKLFPAPVASDEIVGMVGDDVAAATGLPAGLPVVAGCMDCVASPLGAGAVNQADVTIIVGTWSINSVVVPTDSEPPRVTLNALLPDPSAMLAQEVAPTSAAAVEWFAALMSGASSEPVTPQRLLADAARVDAGAGGLLFLPFIHGAPGHPAASGTLLGAKGSHAYPHVARAVVEGVTQYHRVQMDTLRASGAVVSQEPWTLAGGGGRNPVWAQMFADILDHPVRRATHGELGARGVAWLAGRAIDSSTTPWAHHNDHDMVVQPGPNRDAYREQAARFDSALAAMDAVW